jgi:hypothetical protein
MRYAAMSGMLFVISPLAASAQTGGDTPAFATSSTHSGLVVGRGATCPDAAVIYDTTHSSSQGAELTPAANGASCGLADKIVLGATMANRHICQIQVELFTLASVEPFDLTLSLYTDCTSSGAGNSPCGNGTGVLIPGSEVTVTGVTPPATLGEFFTVNVPYPNLDISSEADNTISVLMRPSRSDVFWRIAETPVIGAIPAGEPATSFVERCGSSAANNGCSRNFGVNNNFAMTITAGTTTPVELLQMSVD